MSKCCYNADLLQVLQKLMINSNDLVINHVGDFTINVNKMILREGTSTRRTEWNSLASWKALSRTVRKSRNKNFIKSKKVLEVGEMSAVEETENSPKEQERKDNSTDDDDGDN